MRQRLRLLLLIPHLGGGGAERITAILAQYLDRHRFEVHLCLLTADGPGAQQPPDWVRVHRLQCSRVRHAWLPLLRLIHAQRPDVILSGMAHLNFLILLLKPFLPRRTRILVRQNTTASAAARTRLSRIPYRHLYPRADSIICQSPAMAADLKAHFRLPNSKLQILPNPVNITAMPSEPASFSTTLHLLAVGRLSREKGLDLLLHALPRIRTIHPKLRLTILGTGPEASNLHKLATQLGLADAVTFPGYRDPADYYAASTLFVLPSRYEGMPNVLLEAAAAGLPIVATPCSVGVSDLLQNAPGTWLTASISAESLAETILTALAQLQIPPQRFHHAFLTPFEAQAAVAAYAAHIEQTAARNAP
jgi:glycosyltransferase involved in cell wall biosynthesis